MHADPAVLIVTYRHAATRQLRELAMELPETTNSNAAAWGAGLRAVCSLAGWNRHDVEPVRLQLPR